LIFLGNIRVFCRVRPLSSSETADGALPATDYPAENTIRVSNKRFEFDRVFKPSVDQGKLLSKRFANLKLVNVFQEVQPLAVSVLDGFNVCIFAYGQTGSGKTYTMVLNNWLYLY
jgi:kinesin family protein C2/C3